MITIKEVAKEAGVSITTVSRVLNNKGYISADTRHKVQQAMKKLDYHPHQIARALSKKQSFLVGLIIPDSSLPFFAQLGTAIEQQCYALGYKVILCNSLNDREKEQSYIQMLRDNRVDGIIMGSHALDLDDYQSLDRPVITFERSIEGVPFVSSDNYLGGQLATQHLIDAGCKRLLHISGPLNLSILANRRSDAFQLTCTRQQIDYTIVEYEHTHLDFNYYVDYIEQTIAPILGEYDGVFCSNDYLAYALYLYCQKTSIQVPETLKIIGYDYSQFAQILASPKLTTIAQPIDTLGHQLAKGLITLIEKEDMHSQQLPVTLIQGQTT